jgi:antibiotic biosynthesis monooxygenase (ABM) superfamily enzyme
MSEDPRKRWFQFSMLEIVFWTFPYAAILAWIMAQRDQSPASNDLFGDALGEAMFLTLKLIAVVVVTMAWPVVFVVTKLAVAWLRRGAARKVCTINADSP